MLERQYKELNISDSVVKFVSNVESELKSRFAELETIAECNQLKVLKAMQDNRVSDIHFAATTGYGYNDLGRDTLENVYASVFHTEAALVRPQIISGTHALTVALSGNLRPGDEILSPAGKLYDTLEGVIGLTGSRGSLMEYGVTFKQVNWLDNGTLDFEGIKEAINEKTKIIAIQRSKGYDWRPTMTIPQIKTLISFVKSVKPDVICMVDNCYGEFTQTLEPSDVGADMVVGSLIKNPGGGLSPVGGYIAGKEECIENAAARLTAPGLGREVGPTLGVIHLMYQGLFLAPQVVCGAIKGAIFAAAVFEKLGYKVIPSSKEERNDIVQAINMETEEAVVAFCKGIQAAAPVDSYVVPIPWDMPGYDSKVIMAAGAFIQGSSIELSADAPIKPPYTVYFQGGLTWYHAKFGVIKAVQALVDAGVLKEENLV